MKVEELRKMLQDVPGKWTVYAATDGIAFFDLQGRCRGTLCDHETYIHWSQSPTGEESDEAWNEEREAELEKLQQHKDRWGHGGPKNG